MAPSIPDRWIPYKACGNIIEGTRIICFKVPLRRIVQAKVVASKDIWDIKALLKAIPKLRAVIDLTNTARYYDPTELKSANILHRKLLMPGRELPPESKVTQFFNTVDVCLGVDEDSLIGVHCTHGLNRTGYMVCRYMRDRLGIPAKEAINRFEEARGYKIERANYIADLLGKTPPPPDIGKETIVKPIVNKSKVEYRSPLNDYDDEDNKQESRKRRFGNKGGRFSAKRDDPDDEDNKQESRKRTFGNKSGRCSAKRDDPSEKRSRHKKQSDSNSKYSSYQYDYKYDYKYDY